MARKHYSLHYVPCLTTGDMVLFPTAMQGRLLAYAETEPGVESIELGGPTWRFEDKGKQKTTTVQLTIGRRDGGSAYWNAVERDYPEEPVWLQVVREHARLRGYGHWALTQGHIATNIIEFKNRVSAHHLLFSARGYDSRALESEVLLAVDAGPSTVEELAARLQHSSGQVKVAALRLWKRGLLSLPLVSALLSDKWCLTRGSHAAS